MKTIPLAKLTAAHEKAVAAFALNASKAFDARARWLIARIKREIPQLGGIVYCNGESWLVQAGYPKTPDAMIAYVKPHAGQAPDNPATYQDRLQHALTFANGGGDVPHVSARCVEWLRELDDLATYCEDSRLHTLETIYTL